MDYKLKYLKYKRKYLDLVKESTRGYYDNISKGKINKHNFQDSQIGGQNISNNSKIKKGLDYAKKLVGIKYGTTIKPLEDSEPLGIKMVLLLLYKK